MPKAKKKRVTREMRAKRIAAAEARRKARVKVIKRPAAPDPVRKRQGIKSEAERRREAGEREPQEVKGAKHSGVLTTSNGTKLNRAEAGRCKVDKTDGLGFFVKGKHGKHFSKYYPERAGATKELRAIKAFSNGGKGDPITPAIAPNKLAAKVKAQKEREGYSEPAAHKAHMLAMDLAQGKASPGTMRKVSLLDPPKEKRGKTICVFTDPNSHVALRYYRGDNYTEAVVIADGGSVQTIRMTNRAFEERFRTEGAIGCKDEFDGAEKLMKIVDEPIKGREHHAKAIEVLKEIITAKQEGRRMAEEAAKRKKLRKAEREKAIANHVPVIDETKIRAAAERGQQVAAASNKRGAGLPKGRGIGAFCRELLKKGKETAEILKEVQKQFPGARTTPACVAWYRNDMRQKGDLPKAAA